MRRSRTESSLVQVTVLAVVCVALWAVVYSVPFVGVGIEGIRAAVFRSLGRAVLLSPLVIGVGVSAAMVGVRWRSRWAWGAAVVLVLPALMGAGFAGVSLGVLIDAVGLDLWLARRAEFRTQTVLYAHFVLQWAPAVTGIVMLYVMGAQPELVGFARVHRLTFRETVGVLSTRDLIRVVGLLVAVVFAFALFDGGRAHVSLRGGEGSNLLDVSGATWEAYQRVRNAPDISIGRVAAFGTALWVAVLATSLLLARIVPPRVLRYSRQEATARASLALSILGCAVLLASPFITPGAWGGRLVPALSDALPGLFWACVIGFGIAISAVGLATLLKRPGREGDRRLLVLVVLGCAFLAMPPALVRLVALRYRLFPAEAGVVWSWGLALLLHWGPLLLAYAYAATPERTRDIGDYLKAHRLKLVERGRLLLRLAVIPVALTFLLAVSLSLTDLGVGQLVSGVSPPLAVLLERAFEGRTGGGTGLVAAYSLASLLNVVVLAGLTVAIAGRLNRRRS